LKPCAQLWQSCAQGFNPLGSPTNEGPNAPLAIDGDPNTYWQTQHYDNNALAKAGTGLYLEPGSPTTARELDITTDTPGFTVTIYARDSAPPLSWPDSSWVKISAPMVLSQRNTTIPLSAGTTSYGYYLVWITSLGPQSYVDLNEVVLYHYV
jgi:hypothetical protein